jgi:Zn-dependent M28 family amino/carboxypeptidase
MLMKRRLTLGLAVCIATLAGHAIGQTVRSSQLFNSQALLKDLQTLSADDMQGRQVGTPGGQKAREYVLDRFKASGVTPIGGEYLQLFTFTAQRRETHGVNVIGEIAGRRTPRQYIIVSAHYDHLGVRDGVVFNGADDNASGTAALFAIASYFKAHPPANSLIMAAFDAEESGLRGSQAFVAAPPVDKSSIVIDVNLDMIGREPNDKLFVVGTLLNPFLKPYIEKVAAKAPVKLLMGHDDPRQKDVEDWTADSDHVSFQKAGIPAIYLGVEDFSEHHKATDDYETMTYDFYIRAVETSIGVIQSFDDNLDAIARQGKPGK